MSDERPDQEKDKKEEPPKAESKPDDTTPTECGLTRAELRVLVAEMIG